MSDTFFPKKKRSLFVKTYSKVRPLQMFAPSYPSHSTSAGGTPTIQPGKPFPFIIPSSSIAPTLAPANSPSSDSSSSESCDVEMTSSDVEKPPSTEDEDEKTFVTITPGSNANKSSHSKKPNKKKSCNPLQNISNVIKVIHSNQTVPKRAGSPFMWTCTKVRPHGRLASIQESGQESSSNDGLEGASDIIDKPNKKPDGISNPSKDSHDVKMLDCHNIRGGIKRNLHLQSQARNNDSPMIVQGRGMFNRQHSTILDEQRSTQLYGSSSGADELSTCTYTRELGETSDVSTINTSDTWTDGQYSTTTDTVRDEDFSDIEIPRDFSGPASVMKQLIPKVAQLILPDAAIRTTPKKTIVSTTKAMPRKFSSALQNKKPTVIRAKNSTLLEGVSALNIQEYAPIEEISDIQELTSRPDLVSRKITSTPTSKGRNTMVHQRFIPDVSSIDGDACALPTIDAMPSMDSTMFADNIKPSTSLKPGVKPVSAPIVTPVPTHRSVYSLSDSSNCLTEPLSIKGRKALTLERESPRLSARVSFGQYPTAATKTPSETVKKNTQLVSAGNTSRNGSSSSSKRVKFLLSKKAHEVLPDPDLSMSRSAVHLPELPPSSSILKKRGNTNAVSEISTTKTEDPTKASSSKETNRTGKAQMTSTPQRSSRRTRGVHMLELSFDVSAVDFPSCSDDDLITRPSSQSKAKTTTKEAHHKMATSNTTRQSKLELIDVEPTPMQVSNSITGKQLHPARDAHEDEQSDTLLETECTVTTTPVITQSRTQETQYPVYDQPSEPQHPVHAIQAQGSLKEAQHPLHGTQLQGNLQKVQYPFHGIYGQESPKDAQHPVYTAQAQDSLQESQHPVHATPRAQLKRSSPNGDLPGRPNKKKFLEKVKSDSAMECTPQTCDHATQKNFHRQQKRLEYADKAVGPPECIISRLGPTLIKPARFWQYVDNTTDALDYESIKNMPQDIMETISDALFS